MKVLTTDLDRTFIFSARTVNRPVEDLVCIEQLDGEDLSFVSQQILAQIDELPADQIIIPVTTRALHQYERITLFQQIYKPKYAVVANGGVVLKDGVRDPEWDAHIKTEQQDCMAFAELPQVFHEQWQHPMFRRLTDADQLFYVLMLHEDLIDIQSLNELSAELETVGWKSYKNGRKFYVLPQYLKKEAAVQYVLTKLSYSEHWAAGDSIMDFGMMKIADTAFTPRHGELCKTNDALANVKVLEEKGIEFTEQLLQKMMV